MNIAKFLLVIPGCKYFWEYSYHPPWKLSNAMTRSMYERVLHYVAEDKRSEIHRAIN